jgi:hypothetical protein
MPMKGLTGFSLWTMALLAIGVAVQSMRYELVPMNIWLGVDAAIRSVIERVPLQMLTHAIAAPFALLLGPFQFFPGLRARHPRVHRWTGRIYVMAVLVGGSAALATAPFASGGPIAALGFATLAASWLGVTFAGWRAAVARRFEVHRVLMRFSYAMTFAAVTLRLQIPFGLAVFHFASYRDMSPWLAYTSWIPNVVVVAIYSLVLAALRPVKSVTVAA